MDEIAYVILNIAVNIYQGFIVTYFLMNCMERKAGLSKRLVYMAGTGIIGTFLNVELFITAYEEMWVFLTYILMIIVSVIFFKAKYIEKIVYCAIIFVITVFASALVGSLIGFLNGYTYLDLVLNNSIYKAIAMLVTQIVIGIIVILALRFINHRKLGKSIISTSIMVAIATIGIFENTLLLMLITDRNNNDITYMFGALGGMVILIALCFVIYRNAENNYSNRIEHELQLQALREQQKDVELINYNIQEISKVRHELNRVMNTMEMLIDDNKIDEAKNFIKQFDSNYVSNLKKVYYTDNIILNYVINRKVAECDEKEIKFKCVINGNSIWIEDGELHCVVGNLLDNAIEAAQIAENKQICLELNCNEECLNIDISNTVANNYVVDSELKTTKKNSSIHGYGLKNVRAIVKKYNGEIEFSQKENKFICSLMLIRS